MWMGRGDSSIQPITEICEVTERMELCQGDPPPLSAQEISGPPKAGAILYSGQVANPPLNVHFPPTVAHPDTCVCVCVWGGHFLLRLETSVGENTPRRARSWGSRGRLFPAALSPPGRVGEIRQGLLGASTWIFAYRKGRHQSRGFSRPWSLCSVARDPGAHLRPPSHTGEP